MPFEASCQAENHDKSPILSQQTSNLLPKDGVPMWDKLQKYSFLSWASSLPTKILSSRTPFAEFIRSSLQSQPLHVCAGEQALFPLPIPKHGLFRRLRCGGRMRRRIIFDRVFHMIIMALNFWHADFTFVPLESLCKRPSSAQIEVFRNLKRLLRAFGSCEETFDLPACGRRIPTLMALLADLSDVVTWEGVGGDPYFRAFAGTTGGLAEFAPRDLSRAPELIPYRALDPSRLKLSGRGQWDPAPYLSDALWMAYMEPAALLWTSHLRTADGPLVAREDPLAVQGLVPVWDMNGLLWLRDVPLQQGGEDLAMRFFNCYKSNQIDRMIGDRRSRNYVEGRLTVASSGLPSSQCLLELEVNAATQRLSICCADRKDFYHQFQVSPQRASTNACFPLVPKEVVQRTAAFGAWTSRNMKKAPYDRLKQGDQLGFQKGSTTQKKMREEPTAFQICFNSIPQGDHLGVEFATEAHRGLLIDAGLMSRKKEMRAGHPYRGRGEASGLVIDDFYSISTVPADLPASSTAEEAIGSTSVAVQDMLKAKEIYNKAGLLGSDDKDVWDACHAKVTGAEIDSSLPTRRKGMTLIAAPIRKRLALAFVSLELCSLRTCTDALWACLIGGWTSCLMYRRPLMSLFSEVYQVIDVEECNQEAPKVIGLSRKAAQEVLLAAVLCPLCATDVAVPFMDKLFSTDSSDAKGAVVSRTISPSMTRILWRTGRKKSSYVRMLTRAEAVVRKLDWDREEDSFGHIQDPEQPERPRAFRFHFIEICGGAGKVTRAVSSRGWICGPVLDLDASEHYDLACLKVISWLFHLLEQGWLDSFMVEPPCTTFSPAQHPASRSYEKPRGFDPTEKKTLKGTTLALRALALMDLASVLGVPGLLEQPRRSKMRRLAEWLFLVQNGRAHEVWTSSCMFGSPHQKEFVFLLCNMSGEGLHRACTKDHDHIPVAGAFTKPSATYTDELAEALAGSFDRALKQKFSQGHYESQELKGLETPLCNDLLLGGKWEEEKVWRWKSPRHINIQESFAAVCLFKKLAVSSPRCRFVTAMDSNVSLSSLVKGRSPSYGLRPVMRKAGATLIAGCLYPSYHFGPTRLLPADHPSRDAEMPKPSLSFLKGDEDEDALYDLMQVSGLRRHQSNWVRLCLLLLSELPPWFGSSESWRFSHVAVKHHPARHGYRSSGGISSGDWDFDFTCGYPGEGPYNSFSRWCNYVFLTGPVRCLSFSLAAPLVLWNLLGLDFSAASAALSLLLPATAVCIFGFSCCPHRCPVGMDFEKGDSSAIAGGARSFRPCSVGGSPKVGFWFILLILSARTIDAVSHGPRLLPRDAREKARAAGRVDFDLPRGRPVLGKTQQNRDRLLDQFDDWLMTEGFSLQKLLFVGEPDIEAINVLLEKYGRQLYKAGRPYGHYAETINGIAGRRPRIRRSLQPAWDLAYGWLRQEPPVHHLALPWQALLCLLSTSLSWGWTRVAGVIALSWGSLSRIGEVLSAARQDLILPSDVGFSIAYGLLQIAEPKTRYRAARHQIAKIDQPQLLKVVQIAFQNLDPRFRLWPQSGQTMRARFQRLIAACGLDKLPRSISRGIDLGSLRAGGASWMLMVSEDSEMTRRRGRWINAKIMEIYVQEAWSIQFLHSLTPEVKTTILDGAAFFPVLLETALAWHRSGIPERVWHILLHRGLRA